MQKMPPTSLHGASASTVSAPAPGGEKKKPPPGVSEENAVLRRENQELRQQLLQLVAAAAPPTGNTTPSALPATYWLEAQLKHCRRQVQLLSDALVLKQEITADLEAVLTQILQQKPPPAAQQVQFCRAALRKLKGVEFAEDAAREIKSPADAQRGGGQCTGTASAPRLRTARAAATAPATATRARVPSRP